MALEDIYTAALLVALFVFSVAVTRFINRKRAPTQDPGKDSAEDAPSPLSDAGDGSAPAEIPAKEIKVTFSKSGKQYPWDPDHDSLLEFAESQGIDIDFQCREGECGSCETRLLSGDVEYRRQPQVVLSPGYCLMCISIPKSDVILET
jgi:ferredoxin